ncbi:hypothetical protein BDW22DRAFT_1480926 [Trametopsis cervina]|nr:hypothetical protein BDW22DRAFT_1480926 [Trametopsis cervina]
MDPSAETDPVAEVDKKQAVEDVSELFQPRPPRSWDYWLVLLVAVVPIWSVMPVSWGYVLYILWFGQVWTLGWKGRVGLVISLAEVCFSVYHYQLARYVGGPCVLGPGNLTELQAGFKRILQSGMAGLPEHGCDEEDVGRPGSPEEEIITLHPSDPRAIDFRNYLRTWFSRSTWSSIRKHEMYQWIHWAIFNAPFESREQLSEARRVLLDEVMESIEKRAGSKIPEGSNPEARPLRLTLDPVTVVPRPFVWYLGVALSNSYHRRHFEARWGCKFGTHDGLESVSYIHTISRLKIYAYPNHSYLLRIPRNAKRDAAPVVFLHGLGLGLTQYKIFISHLLKAIPDRPVLVPLQPHVSQEIFHPRFLRPMGRHESAKALAGLLLDLGWVNQPTDESEPEDASRVEKPGVAVVSHSNGSFLHAWLLKEHPRMVARSCFVDPVTFCSWEGDLCYNFIYRPATSGLELVMKYFVGTELGVANFLQRHFDWNANALWYEQIPNARDPHKARFFLGGQDAIVDAERVKRYLTSHGIREGLWFDPDGHHGQALLTGGKGHTEILRWLAEKETQAQ